MTGQLGGVASALSHLTRKQHLNNPTEPVCIDSLVPVWKLSVNSWALGSAPKESTVRTKLSITFQDVVFWIKRGTGAVNAGVGGR